MKMGDVVLVATRVDGDGDLRVRYHPSQGDLDVFTDRMEATLLCFVEDKWLVELAGKAFDGWQAESSHVAKWGCVPGRYYQWINPHALLSLTNKSNAIPLACVRCTTPNEYAVSNLSGNRFVCYSCKPIYKE